MTFTDPTVFTAPLVVATVMELKPDTEMLEYVCENEKDHARMTAGQQPLQEVQLTAEVVAKYAGVYDVVDGVSGKTYPVTITTSGGTLFFELAREGKQATLAFSTTRFSLAGTWLEFTPRQSGGMDILLRSVEQDDTGTRRK